MNWWSKEREGAYLVYGKPLADSCIILPFAGLVRLESNVGMISGNKTASNHTSHLKFQTRFKDMF